MCVWKGGAEYKCYVSVTRQPLEKGNLKAISGLLGIAFNLGLLGGLEIRPE